MDKNEKKLFNSKLRALAVPLALQSLLNALVGASDALMLGRLNQDSIAAVSLANQVFFVMTLFTGAVTGTAAILIAQYWGKKDYKNAGRFLAMAIRYSILISLVFFAAAFICSERQYRTDSIPAVRFLRKRSLRSTASGSVSLRACTDRFSPAPAAARLCAAVLRFRV